jgi:homogentisate 1,2-dioxygenase
MFESTYLLKLTRAGAHGPNVQKNYLDCWKTLERHFDPTWKPVAAAAAAPQS